MATLDPLKLSSSDYIDLSGLAQPTVNTNPTCTLAFYGVGVPFPADTRGFLYYHPPPPGVNLLAGEIRFRLVEDGDPASFDRGSDLMSPTGLPWSIHFLSLNCRNARYKGLRDVIALDGLATPKLIENCDSIAIDGNRSTRAPIVHSLGQPFPASFDRRLVVRILGDDAKAVRISGPFVDQRKKLEHPYTGDTFPLTACVHGLIPIRSRYTVLRTVN